MRQNLPGDDDARNMTGRVREYFSQSLAHESSIQKKIFNVSRDTVVMR